MIVVGIDLGVTGAICATDSRGTASVEDLPIVATEAGKRLDARALIHSLREMIPPGMDGLIVTEDVHVMRVAGRAMSFKTESTLIGIRGAVQAVADIARIRVEFVRPQAWKSHFGIKGDTKGDKARATAASLYPLQAPKLARVKDHNRAEAVLIAHYGRGLFA